VCAPVVHLTLRRPQQLLTDQIENVVHSGSFRNVASSRRSPLLTRWRTACSLVSSATAMSA